jgi:hypothetical protein
MIKRITGLFIISLALMVVFENDTFSQNRKGTMRGIEKSVAGKKRKAPNEAKVREPKSVTKAKRTQEKKEEKREKEYQKSVKAGKKLHYEMQTEDVKERMKQNEKDIKTRDKERKKRQRKDSRSSGVAKKYKK